ncbi:dipeptide/oligopeptide/nickel ABC transporter permease/ATP-binding protein [Amycolatopsis sp.]|uniref:dipeptide/oligopeptide/nickel ABC transporter permease/ATP-binding protein n=1 Tax=Amycolatopsis sp. TaxID=37632 RepID=UPI002D7E25FA|nr:dipeptide/oligopeptide/nickel ABC transporter permease/ATP-binding protein [Amycolatopsis sp.]HET6705364.1 dipeptide/oligopeptide/nickel ABC transporter permease/ATP-binding protein [Amycolatopsis sp.]
MTNLGPATTRASGFRAILPRWSPRLAIGLGLVGAIALFGVLGPLLTGDPAAVRDTGLAPPGGGHPLGLTQTGQDVLAQLAHSTRGSLEIGLLVGVLATVLSAVFGVLGAYVGGVVDEGFSLFSNVMLVIPGLPLVIVIAGFVPPESRGAWTIGLVLAVTGWAAAARVLRAQTLSLRHRDYVAAARVAGEKPWRIIAVEIVPNLLPLLASQFVFAVIWAILSEAALSFLGLGASNSPTLGTMLYFAQNGFALQRQAWWWFVPPGCVIALFGCGLSLINFSLDEVIDPRLRAVFRRRPKPVPAAKLAEGGEPGVLAVDSLDVGYRTAEPVAAVRNVSLTLRRGEILGLAGESGCGKTTLAYAIARLHRPPAEVTAGSIVFHDREGSTVDILGLGPEALREFRWDKLSMVFQGAMNALNPVTTVRAQLDDVLRIHRPELMAAERRARCAEVLRLVGVDPARLSSYAHELSGGMRQRVMIAMALLLDPQVIIMDEPTTALDVVVQRGILREIQRLRDELGIAVLLITHDLPLLLEIADRIAVMKDGEVVELGDAGEMYRAPAHPYTRELLSSFPGLTEVPEGSR